MSAFEDVKNVHETYMEAAAKKKRFCSPFLDCGPWLVVSIPLQSN